MGIPPKCFFGSFFKPTHPQNGLKPKPVTIHHHSHPQPFLGIRLLHLRRPNSVTVATQPEPTLTTRCNYSENIVFYSMCGVKPFLIPLPLLYFSGLFPNLLYLSLYIHKWSERIFFGWFSTSAHSLRRVCFFDQKRRVCFWLWL